MKLISDRSETVFGYMQVSNSEIGNFGQAQGNQGIVRRHTLCMSHKQFRRLTQRSYKRAISGWKLIIMSITATALIICPVPARPDEFKLTPSLTVSEKYNDNIFLTDSDVQKDWVTVLAPGFELVDRTERFDLNLKARLDDIHYNDPQDLNAVDQFYSGRVRFAVNDKMTLAPSAGFSRDSQPDREIDSTGLILSTGRRDKQNYGLSMDYRLHDKTMASVSYKYDAERYDQADQTDWWSQAVSLDLVSDLDRWLRGTGRLNIGYAHYHFEGNTIDSYSATVGLKRDFSEKWSLLADVGGRYTDSSFEVLQATLVPPATIVITSEERSNRGWGTVGQLVMAYKDDFTTGNVTLKKDIMPASGRNGMADRTLVSFDLCRRFTYEFQGFVKGGYYLNKSDSGDYAVQEIDEETMRGDVGVRYEFTRDMFLEFSYGYTKTRDRSNDTDADRNLLLLRFFIQHSILE